MILDGSFISKWNRCSHSCSGFVFNPLHIHNIYTNAYQNVIINKRGIFLRIWVCLGWSGLTEITPYIVSLKRVCAVWNVRCAQLSWLSFIPHISLSHSIYVVFFPLFRRTSTISLSSTFAGNFSLKKSDTMKFQYIVMNEHWELVFSIKFCENLLWMITYKIQWAKIFFTRSHQLN